MAITVFNTDTFPASNGGFSFMNPMIPTTNLTTTIPPSLNFLTYNMFQPQQVMGLSPLFPCCDKVFPTDSEAIIIPRTPATSGTSMTSTTLNCCVFQVFGGSDIGTANNAVIFGAPFSGIPFTTPPYPYNTDDNVAQIIVSSVTTNAQGFTASATGNTVTICPFSSMTGFVNVTFSSNTLNPGLSWTPSACTLSVTHTVTTGSTLICPNSYVDILFSDGQSATTNVHLADVNNAFTVASEYSLAINAQTFFTSYVSGNSMSATLYISGPPGTNGVTWYIFEEDPSCNYVYPLSGTLIGNEFVNVSGATFGIDGKCGCEGYYGADGDLANAYNFTLPVFGDIGSRASCCTFTFTPTPVDRDGAIGLVFSSAFFDIAIPNLNGTNSAEQTCAQIATGITFYDTHNQGFTATASGNTFTICPPVGSAANGVNIQIEPLGPGPVGNFTPEICTFNGGTDYNPTGVNSDFNSWLLLYPNGYNALYNGDFQLEKQQADGSWMVIADLSDTTFGQPYNNCASSCLTVLSEFRANATSADTNTVTFTEPCLYPGETCGGVFFSGSTFSNTVYNGGPGLWSGDSYYVASTNPVVVFNGVVEGNLNIAGAGFDSAVLEYWLSINGVLQGSGTTVSVLPGNWSVPFNIPPTDGLPGHPHLLSPGDICELDLEFRVCWTTCPTEGTHPVVTFPLPGSYITDGVVLTPCSSYCLPGCGGGSLGPDPNLNYQGFQLEWAPVLQAFGTGTYRFSAAGNLITGGTPYCLNSNPFCLQNADCLSMDGTVKFEAAICGGFMGSVDVQGEGWNFDLTGGTMSWLDSIRFGGELGYQSIEIQRDQIKYANGQIEKVRDEIIKTYTLKTSQLPKWLLDRFATYALMADQLYVSDFNLNNADYALKNKWIVADSGMKPSWVNYSRYTRAGEVTFKEGQQTIYRDRC